MLAFERGKVESASGGHLVIRAASGTTWTWSLASNSVIRWPGRNVPASVVPSGARVFVVGQVSGSAKNARLVFVREGKGSSGRRNAPSQSRASSSAA
jgi:hypothetical protein